MIAKETVMSSAFMEILSFVPAHDIEEIAIVRETYEAWDVLPLDLLVEHVHAADEMLGLDVGALLGKQRQIGMLERVHVEMQGVAAVISLEYPHHRRRCGAGEVPVDQIG